MIPAGRKHALQIAANEILFEWLGSVTEDPAGFLASGMLGSTYQSPLGPGVLAPDHEARLLADLAPWDTADATLEAWQRLDHALCVAALDLARAAIAEATGAGAVPPAVAPLASELAPLTEALRAAIANGYFDEESLPALFGDDADS